MVFVRSSINSLGYHSNAFRHSVYCQIINYKLKNWNKRKLWKGTKQENQFHFLFCCCKAMFCFNFIPKCSDIPTSIYQISSPFDYFVPFNNYQMSKLVHFIGSPFRYFQITISFSSVNEGKTQRCFIFLHIMVFSKTM